jgi:hypothetical protein
MTIEDDIPLRLQEACDRFFGGRLTPRSLRTEARKGNLTIERIANKDFVTPSAIQEMRLKCLIVRAPTALDGAVPDGSRSMRFAAERDALLAKLKSLRSQRKIRTSRAL